MKRFLAGMMVGGLLATAVAILPFMTPGYALATNLMIPPECGSATCWTNTIPTVACFHLLTIRRYVELVESPYLTDAEVAAANKTELADRGSASGSRQAMSSDRRVLVKPRRAKTAGRSFQRCRLWAVS